MASTPGLISLGGGMPNPSTFPSKDLKSIIDTLIDTKSASVFQYANTLGVQETLEVIPAYLEKTQSITCLPENVILNSGSQQGLYEIGKVLANTGDTIITEEPTYVGAISAFSASALKMEGIEMDSMGMKTDLLEEKIKKLIKEGRKPAFIYTIPTFQNPTGYTMPLERRKHLLEISRHYEIPLIEDNPYGELRYYGQNVPAIKSLKDAEDVLYLGTFSKVMTPGLRLGYTIAPVEVISKFNLIKQALDLATNTLSQYVAYEYVKQGIIYKQVALNVDLYRKKRDIMINALSEQFPKGAAWSKPEGGMFVWLTIEKEVDTKEMIGEAIKNGVAYVSGQAFSTNGTQKRSMRLNFTYGNDDQLAEGIKRLKKTFGN
ncbi:GntR family transcriptional regulator [mine drainage metagenome]|uniref:GntR family transcriptional regulator n=1 Tax=mine drainage metagenome TaxID=410659 RepID=T1BE36_9ZZZZ